MSTILSLKQNYKDIRLIGKGSAGVVYSATRISDSLRVAIKVLWYSDDDESKLNQIISEIRALTLLKNDTSGFFPKLYDIIETSLTTILILELLPGTELYAYVEKHGRVSEDTFRLIFKKIVLAVNHLHTKYNLIHGDLKLENIVYDPESGRLCLIDFGFSKFCLDENEIPIPHTAACGSTHYVSPEILFGKEYDGRLVDVWALAILLYASLLGKFPFDGKTANQVLLKIKQGKFSYPADTQISENLKDLFSGCLAKYPPGRWTVSILLECDWMKNVM